MADKKRKMTSESSSSSDEPVPLTGWLYRGGNSPRIAVIDGGVISLGGGNWTAKITDTGELVLTGVHEDHDRVRRSKAIRLDRDVDLFKAHSRVAAIQDEQAQEWEALRLQLEHAPDDPDLRVSDNLQLISQEKGRLITEISDMQGAQTLDMHGTATTNVITYTLPAGQSAFCAHFDDQQSIVWVLGQLESPCINCVGRQQSSERYDEVISAYPGRFLFDWRITPTGPGPASCNPGGITVNTDGELYVWDLTTGQITVFSQNGTHLRQFGMDIIVKPTSVIVLGRELLICDSGSHELVVCDLEGNLKRRHPLYVPSHTYDSYLALSGSELIVTYEHGVQLMTLECVPIHNWGGIGSNAGEFSHGHKAVAVSCHISPTVLVCDTLNDRVQVFDRDGEHYDTWGSSGAGNGQFVRPSAIAISATGEVFVGDTSGRIQVLDLEEGKFIRQWYLHQGDRGDVICNITGIALHANKVYVTTSLSTHVHRITFGRVHVYTM